MAHTVAGEQQEAVEALWVVFSVLGGVFLFSIIITAFIAGRVLAPLANILATAKQVNENNLDQRIPITSKGELAELGQAFNSMMDRLEQSFLNQRQFINDAGHELRTPITIIQGHLELMDFEVLPNRRG